MTKVTWQELEAAELIPFKDMLPGDIVVPMNWVVESVEEVKDSLRVTFSNSTETFTRAFWFDMGAEVVRR